MEKVKSKVRFSCDYCGWEGLDVVNIGEEDLFLRCADCGFPILAKRHYNDYLIKQAQARAKYLDEKGERLK